MRGQRPDLHCQGMNSHRLLVLTLVFASIVPCLATRIDDLRYVTSNEASVEAPAFEEGGVDVESSGADDGEAIFLCIACNNCDSTATLSVSLGNRLSSLGFLGHRYRGPPLFAA